MHDGCGCAEGKPRDDLLPLPAPAAGVQPIRRFTDGTPEAPSPDLPDGSQYASLPAPLLAMLRRTLAAKSYWRWVNGKPTNLGAALELVGNSDINTLVQLYTRLNALGLWTYIGTIKGLWSTSSLGIDFTESGSIQGALPEDKFCKDTAVGESYHKGKSCWREMVDPGTPGLHVCVPGGVHIDPHQAVSGKGTGISFGGASWVSFPSRCMYSLMSWIDHMRDVEGGRAVNVFTRRDQDYQRIERERTRIDGLLTEHPGLSTQKDALAALSRRLDTVGVTMRGWALRGFEGIDGSAEAKVVLDELTAIEQGISEVGQAVTTATTADTTPPPGAKEPY